MRCAACGFSWFAEPQLELRTQAVAVAPEAPAKEPLTRERVERLRRAAEQPGPAPSAAAKFRAQQAERMRRERMRAAVVVWGATGAALAASATGMVAFRQDVAELLRAAGAASIATVALPDDLLEGWDLADELPAGLLAADLDRLDPAPLDGLARRRQAHGRPSRFPSDPGLQHSQRAPRCRDANARCRSTQGALLISDETIYIRAGRLTAAADPDRLAQVVANLVENALKHARISIAVGAVAHNRSVALWVEDDGAGITPEDLPHVFDPFYRGEPSRSRETGGAGLGLAVVRSIARAHGGDVGLRNREGGGLTVRVTLPL